jgi:hypothetical protein
MSPIVVDVRLALILRPVLLRDAVLLLIDV